MRSCSHCLTFCLVFTPAALCWWAKSNNNNNNNNSHISKALHAMLIASILSEKLLNVQLLQIKRSRHPVIRRHWLILSINDPDRGRRDHHSQNLLFVKNYYIDRDYFTEISLSTFWICYRQTKTWRNPRFSPSWWSIIRVGSITFKMYFNYKIQITFFKVIQILFSITLAMTGKIQNTFLESN